MDYVELRKWILKERPDLNLEAVDLAHDFAKKAYGDLKRYSGEPAIAHSVALTALLLQLKPDLPTVQAGLMHDLIEDTEVTLENIRAVFGEEVAELLEACAKLSSVRVAEASAMNEDRWHKLFLAMSKDIRIVFIKLADRLHNMRTLNFVPAAKRQRIAKETMMIHAAIAGRLGIYQFKSELQDLCFKYLYPEEFKKLEKELKDYRKKSEAFLIRAEQTLQEFLTKKELSFLEIQGRFKHLWSIHEKLQSKGVERLEDLYDLFALRVILPDRERQGEEDVSHLYSTLGLLHAEFLPLQDRFKDYVAFPKPNGYRSLHSTLIGLFGDGDDLPAEVQIRTERMHRESEIGVASHMDYKTEKKLNKKIDQRRHFSMQKALNHIQEILDKHPELKEEIKEWVENYQRMSFADRSRVEKLMKSKGLSDLEVDQIHKARSQEAIRLSSTLEKQLAWLRGLSEEDATSLEMELYNDRIFVMTPKRDLIELPKGATPVDFAYSIHSDLGNHLVHAKINGRIVPLDYELKNGEVVEVGTRNDAKPNPYWASFVKSSSARAKIKAYFSKMNKEEGEVLSVSAENSTGVLKKTEGAKGGLKKNDSNLPTIEVLVTGEQGLPLVFSSCCKPKMPDEIVAFVGRGKRLRIHRQDCRELSGLEERRLIVAHWKG